MSYNPLSLSHNVSPTVGDKISLNVKHKKHFIDFDQTLEGSGNVLGNNTQGERSKFYNNLIQTLTSINNEIVNADKLTEKFMVEPEKVNVHDVMIALQKSKLNLDLTRTVIQKSIEGYKTIINLR